MSYGIITVAFGQAAQVSVQRLKRSVGDIPLEVIDQPCHDLYPPYSDEFNNWQLHKLAVDRLSPFEYTLYLDADTVVQGDVMAGFELLDQGWDVLMSFSEKQGGRAMWHIGPEERDYTVQLLRHQPLQLQAGVLFFAKNPAVTALFAAWRHEWMCYGGKDQAAFLRALHNSGPVRLGLLGRPWNTSKSDAQTQVLHRFGAARMVGR